MARQETSHPILVSTANEYVPGCGMDDCRKWGSGVLRLEQGKDKITASLVLTAAGCEVCADVRVESGDVAVVRDFTHDIPTGDAAAKQIASIQAHGRLGLIVDALPVQHDNAPMLGEPPAASDS